MLEHICLNFTIIIIRIKANFTIANPLKSIANIAMLIKSTFQKKKLGVY